MQCAPASEITGIVYALPGQLIVYTDRVMAVLQINIIRLSSSFTVLQDSFRHKVHFSDCTQCNVNGNDAKGYPSIRQRISHEELFLDQTKFH